MTRVIRVLAPNPGPYTLEGTNTWVVGEDPSLVIDPGPPDDGHVAEVVRTAGAVAAILLTHHHPDHAPAAGAMASLTGAPVLARHAAGGETELEPGETVVGGGARLEVVASPGHTSDHVVFFERGGRSLFTGDAVLGRGTSVVDPPDGDMAAYLASLHAMLELDPAVIYPGHGPAAWSARAKLMEYLEHRAMRQRQVLEGLRAGPKTATELVPGIYGEYPTDLHGPAARSLLAHLVSLERDGRVTRVSRGDGEEDAFITT